MTPSEVLDAQGDLLIRLEDHTFADYARKMMRYQDVRPHVALAGMNIREPDDAGLAALKSAARAAYAYRVSHDMSILVEHAADSLNEEDKFDRSLAPTGCGFVSFDRPIPVIDARGLEMLIHFMVWAPDYDVQGFGPGTTVWVFNDTYRKMDEAWELMWNFVLEDETITEEEIERMTRCIGRWATVGSFQAVDGRNLGPAMIDPDSAQKKEIIAEGQTPHAGTNVNRIVHALWLLMNQTITVVEEEIPERASRRRAQKRGMPSGVTVIKLRREELRPVRKDGESHVEWQHRWIVRGHWRWQVCGEHHPLAQEIEPGKFRCRIWINPFEKGPEGAPLMQTEKVYSLER
jgi:hypothetical protein